MTKRLVLKFFLIVFALNAGLIFPRYEADRAIAAPETKVVRGLRAVQVALNVLGFNAGKVDGAMGSGTRSAIIRFQRSIGAAGTGRLTQEQVSILTSRAQQRLTLMRNQRDQAGTAQSGEGVTSGRFRRFNGADMSGNDYRDARTDTGLRNISLPQCEAICGQDPQCAAYTYNTNARWCFLKSLAGPLKPFGGAVSGVRLAPSQSVAGNVAAPAIGAARKTYDANEIHALVAQIIREFKPADPLKDRFVMPSGEPAAKAKAILEQAFAELEEGKRERARELFREAIRVYATEAAGDPPFAYFIEAREGGSLQRHVSAALGELELQAERQWLSAKTAAEQIRDREWTNNAGLSWVYALLKDMEDAESFSLADAYHTFLSHVSRQRSGPPSPLPTRLIMSEQLVDEENYTLAEKSLERTIAIAQALGRRDSQVDALSKLARVHDEQGNLEKAARFASLGLRLAKPTDGGTKGYSVELLETILAKAQEESRESDAIFRKLVHDVNTGLDAACRRGGKPNSFPSLPVLHFIDDPSLAGAFLESRTSARYLECFGKLKGVIDGIARPWSDMVSNAAITDALFLLGLQNDIEQFHSIVDFYFRKGIWVHDKNDAQLRASIPDKYFRHVPASKRLESVRNSSKHNMLEAFNAVLKAQGLLKRKILTDRQEAFLRQEFSKDRVRQLVVAASYVPSSLTRIAISAHSAGLSDIAKTIYDVTLPLISKEAADVLEGRTCQSLDACEMLVVLDSAFGKTAEVDLHAERIPNEFIVLNSGASMDSAEADAIDKLALEVGREHEALGRLRLAEIYYGMSGGGDGSQDDGSLTNYDQIRTTSSLARLALLKGEKSRARDLTARTISQARRRLSGDAAFGSSSIIRWSHRLREIFETHLDALDADANGELKKTDEAFFAIQFLQTTRTALTVAKVADRSEASSGASIRKFQDNSAELAKLQTRLLFAEPRESKRIIRKIEDLEQANAKLGKAIRSENPAFYQLASFEFPTLDVIQSSLEMDQAVLLAFNGSRHAYLWLVMHNGSRFVRLKQSPDEIERMIKKIRSNVEDYLDSNPSPESSKAWDVTAYWEPYEAMLLPFEAELANTRRIFFVPAGAFDTLPLGVLLTKKPQQPRMTFKEMRDAKLAWHVRRFSASVLPSVASLRDLKDQKPAGDKQQIAFLGVGNPQFAEGVPVSAMPTRSAGDKRFRVSPLPETEVEITKISELLESESGNTLLIGANASEPALKRANLAQYRIIHFATHAFLANELPGVSEPGIILTLPKKATAQNDGLLLSSEISALRLDAELVILSACNTAADDGKPGASSLSGLANSFLYAGARNIIATHWRIPSEPAVVISVGMIESHNNSSSKNWDEALKTSIVDVIDNVGPAYFVHPANWGAHIVVGLSRPHR